MKYSECYRERAALDDGVVIEFRAIAPSDKAALADGFARLSVESRRRRFFSPKTALRDEELRYFTECDGIDHYAIGAQADGEPGGPPTGVGVARYVRTPDDPASAELAIVVVDAWQRRGIGKRLLERIVAAATERGIERIRGETLADNEQIRGLLEQHAGQLETRAERGVLQFSFPVPHPDRPDMLDALVALLRLAALTPIVAPIALGRLSLRQVSAFASRFDLDARHHRDNPSAPDQ